MSNKGLPALKRSKEVTSYPNSSEIRCIIHSINSGRVQTQVVVSAEIPLELKFIC